MSLDFIYRCPKIGVQTTDYPYRGCLTVHEKNMEKMFPTKKKTIIFIITVIQCKQRYISKLRTVIDCTFLNSSSKT
jgi:hypothetical protein